MKESKDSINRCKEDKNDCKNEDHKNKKAQLNIRLSQTEKRRLKRKAIKNGLNLSEYIRAMLSGGDRKQQGPGMVSQCVVICQDIIILIIFLIWLKAVKTEELRVPFLNSIQAMKDGYGIGVGIIAIFVLYGIPICLLVALFL